jgi:hypothetical protein
VIRGHSAENTESLLLQQAKAQCGKKVRSEGDGTKPMPIAGRKAGAVNPRNDL